MCLCNDDGGVDGILFLFTVKPLSWSFRHVVDLLELSVAKLCFPFLKNQSSAEKGARIKHGHLRKSSFFCSQVLCG